MKIASKVKWKAVGVYGKLKGIPDVYAASLLLRSYIADYRKHIYPIYKTLAIHKKGFTAYNWALSELDQNDYQRYLSDLQYYRMHPINGDQSWIIDSKLSLKKICVGTPADQYMPEYYFFITSEGLLQPLSDYHGEKCSKTDWNLIVELLKKKGALAVKRSAGSIGEGFYKCSYESGIFFANEAKLENPVEFFSGLRDYLVTEYLMPHPDIAAICPNTANAIRYLVGRYNNSLNYLKGFIRFGTRASGYVENYKVGGVLCYLDRDGYYKEGNVIEKGSYKNRKIHKHPDSGAVLKGRIPCWKEIQSAVKLFGDQFPQLDYLGFDFVVTSDGRVIILEINSLTSLDCLQLNGSILKTEAAEFYKSRMR